MILIKAHAEDAEKKGEHAENLPLTGGRVLEPTFPRSLLTRRVLRVKAVTTLASAVQRNLAARLRRSNAPGSAPFRGARRRARSDHDAVGLVPLHSRRGRAPQVAGDRLGGGPGNAFAAGEREECDHRSSSFLG
jgi:hypothetical protein